MISIALGVLGFIAGHYSVGRLAPVERSTGSFESGIKPPSLAATGGKGANAYSSGTLSLASPEYSERGRADRWRSLLAQPATRARNDAISAWLEKVATTDPARALALAQSEANLMFRNKFVQASLQGWAHSSPAEAAKWALSMPPPEGRETAIAAVFAGAVATDPKAAIALGRQLFAENPGEAVSYGGHLIDLLCETGDFEAAAQLASAGAPNQTSFWLGQAYSKWAAYQPQQALQSATALSDPEERKIAMRSLVSGWTEADPMSAVQHVVELPDNSERAVLVSQALQRWTKVDLRAASAWINNNEMGGAMDEGVASVATMEALKPDIALSWAESVVDPKLRSETLVAVLRKMAPVDLGSTQQYFSTSMNLLPDDRQEIAGLIETLGGRASDGASRPMSDSTGSQSATMTEH